MSESPAPTSTPRSLRLHTLVCVALGVAYLCFASFDFPKPGSLGPISPMQTTDKYLSFLISQRDASERVIAACAALPDYQPLVVVSPDGTGESLLSGIVMYLAWPRAVRGVSLDGPESEKALRTALAQPHSGILFCKMEPPPVLQPVFRLGDGLILFSPQEAMRAARR